MTHKQLLGRILICVGKALCNPDSELSRSIDVSEEQLFSIVRFARILTSPSVQVLYLHDLAERFRKSPKTIQNWIALGLIRPGHKRKHDTRAFWYASEIDEDSKLLRHLGYISAQQSPVMRIIERARSFLCFRDCAE